MIALSVALVMVAAILLVGMVLILDRYDRQQQVFAREREQWVVERRELNQRIQAPEIATVQAIDVTREGPAYVSPENDNDYWQAAMTGG